MLTQKPDIILLGAEEPVMSPTGYGMSRLDGTEHIFGISSETSEVMENIMPSKFSYRETMPKVDNQGYNPWCVAYSLSAILNSLLNIKKRSDNIDYGIDEKVIFDLREDKRMEGMFPKTALHEAKHNGIYIESLGENLKIKGYSWAGTVAAMKAALLLNGPLLAGIMVRSWDNVNFWDGYDNHGGHAICICGYDDEKGAFEFRNSWGRAYGKGGYWNIDYDTAIKEFLECWTVYL